jgi:hypothetical protein
MPVRDSSATSLASGRRSDSPGSYDWLDADADTERSVRGWPKDQEWRGRLDYLRDLQRIGARILAEYLDS